MNEVSYRNQKVLRVFCSESENRRFPIQYKLSREAEVFNCMIYEASNRLFSTSGVV